MKYAYLLNGLKIKSYLCYNIFNISEYRLFKQVVAL